MWAARARWPCAGSPARARGARAAGLPGSRGSRGSPPWSVGRTPQRRAETLAIIKTKKLPFYKKFKKNFVDIIKTLYIFRGIEDEYGFALKIFFFYNITKKKIRSVPLAPDWPRKVKVKIKKNKKTEQVTRPQLLKCIKEEEPLIQVLVKGELL